jgi:signal transduction histidine kinase
VFERTPVAVADVLRDALAAFDAATLGCPTPVAVQVESELAVVGDRPGLARALSNLLVNSWKYTGAEKQIAVEARRSGRWIEIAVSDNGMGIPRDERRTMFEEFARGKEATRRGTPGVGLGLALVRAIVRAHRGSIEVTSREGHGSTFRLRLPGEARSAGRA